MYLCLYFEEGGSGEPLRRFYNRSLSSISTPSSSTTPYITHAPVYTENQEYPPVLFLLFHRKSRALGADCSTHQHVAALAIQHRSACCGID